MRVHIHEQFRSSFQLQFLRKNQITKSKKSFLGSLICEAENWTCVLFSCGVYTCFLIPVRTLRLNAPRILCYVMHWDVYCHWEPCWVPTSALLCTIISIQLTFYPSKNKNKNKKAKKLELLINHVQFRRVCSNTSDRNFLSGKKATNDLLTLKTLTQDRTLKVKRHLFVLTAQLTWPCLPYSVHLGRDDCWRCRVLTVQRSAIVWYRTEKWGFGSGGKRKWKFCRALKLSRGYAVSSQNFYNVLSSAMERGNFLVLAHCSQLSS